MNPNRVIAIGPMPPEKSAHALAGYNRSGRFHPAAVNVVSFGGKDFTDKARRVHHG